MNNLTEKEKQRLLEYFQKFYSGGERMMMASDCPGIFDAGLVEAGSLTAQGSEFCLTSYPDEPDVQRVQQIRERVIKETKPGDPFPIGKLLLEFAEAERALVRQVLTHFKRTTQTVRTDCWVRDW